MSDSACQRAEFKEIETISQVGDNLLVLINYPGLWGVDQLYADPQAKHFFDLSCFQGGETLSWTISMLFWVCAISLISWGFSGIVWLSDTYFFPWVDRFITEQNRLRAEKNREDDK